MDGQPFYLNGGLLRPAVSEEDLPHGFEYSGPIFKKEYLHNGLWAAVLYKDRMLKGRSAARAAAVVAWYKPWLPPWQRS